MGREYAKFVPRILFVSIDTENPQIERVYQYGALFSWWFFMKGFGTGTQHTQRLWDGWQANHKAAQRCIRSLGTIGFYQGRNLGRRSTQPCGMDPRAMHHVWGADVIGEEW